MNKKIFTPKEIKEILRTIEWTRTKNEYNRSEHRKIWEKHHGKIPKGHFVHHINGDKLDNRIENLILVSRKTHGQLHSWKRDEVLKKIQKALNSDRSTELVLVKEGKVF
jgi:hypothetical protein